MYTNLVFLTVFAIACVSGKSQPGPICPCTREYMPVCGEDGVTYDNKCELKCAGVPKLRKGKCPICPIPAIFAPVCGENLRTYSNKYVPKCLGIKIKHRGPCKPKDVATYK